MFLVRRGLLSVLLALSALGVAFAATISITARPLGAGGAMVSACDADGFSYAYSVDTAGNITTVTVSAINAACAGGMLRLTLTNGTTSVGSGSAALPSSGFSGSASVTIAPTPASNAVTAAHAVVEGP